MDVFDLIWEWIRGQVDEQVGGEEKEQGVGCGVSLIFGMQCKKTPTPPPKKKQTTKKTQTKQMRPEY